MSQFLRCLPKKSIFTTFACFGSQARISSSQMCPLKSYVLPDMSAVSVRLYNRVDRDCALRVLEQVPMGDTSQWCAATMIAAKKNGDPRRTIDFQRLNKACKRQTHAVEVPFHQASAVPPNTRRSVLDAWNGYHSVPLAKEDRSKTTFLTP